MVRVKESDGGGEIHFCFQMRTNFRPKTLCLPECVLEKNPSWKIREISQQENTLPAAVQENVPMQKIFIICIDEMQSISAWVAKPIDISTGRATTEYGAA